MRYQIAVSANGQFGADTDLFDNVVPDANPEWAKGTKSVPAHQTVLSGQYKSQFFRVRAKDALGNTDTNTVIMQHVPGRYVEAETASKLPSGEGTCCAAPVEWPDFWQVCSAAGW